MARFEKAEKIETPRDLLKAAIAERERARKALDDARVAEKKAREHYFEAQRHAADLRREAETHEDGDDVIAAICSGEGHVLELQRPRAEALKEIEIADEKARAWKSAADGAEQAVPVREAAAARAADHVKQCANAALAAAVGVDKLLEEAEQAARTILGLRAKLLFVCTILPRDSAQRAAVSDFLARAWLQDEYSEAWKKNPSVKALADAVAALQHDAEAAIDLASP